MKFVRHEAPFGLVFLAVCVAASENATCDAPTFLQHTSAKDGRFRPREWKSDRDLANVTKIDPIHWGTVAGQDVILTFRNAIPVFGVDGNYIALVHQLKREPLQWYIQSKTLPLFCSGPGGSHRSEVRVVGNESDGVVGKRGRYAKDLVFLCDWPAEESYKDTFKVHLDGGDVTQPLTKDTPIVAKRKAGLLGQYHTMACVRDVWPGKGIGLRMPPQWIEFQLLHGVDHVLLYTANTPPKQTKIIQDIYEPFIKAGKATRVHLDLDFVDDLWHHYNRHEYQMCDCLYRAKGHARWVFPSLDVDEYFNMLDGTLFAGGVVPQDYLGTSWDAIVKNTGLEAKDVHSVSFGLYRFQLAPPGQVELSSTLREDQQQPTCPKFVVNVRVVDTVFCHWVTSWQNGAQGLWLDVNQGNAHHYRTPHSYAIDGHIKADFRDATMAQYGPELSNAMMQRFDQNTKKLLRKLAAAPEIEAIPTNSSLSEVDSELEDAKDLSLASEFSTWLGQFTSGKGIKVIEPPLANAIEPFD
mmetsp:Transcript_24663/g.55579  ORF Transcript_24663/g.55579 Transcript_24663/m.55579 type:complete len:524 (+) Transcript_24663:54-1625(+)